MMYALTAKEEAEAERRGGYAPDFWERIQAKRQALEAAREAEDQATAVTDLYRVITISPRPAVKSIVAYAAAKHGVTPEEIYSPRRSRHIVRARHEAIWLVAKQRPDLSLPQMGRAFGDRDHTTILHAIRRENERRGEKARAA